MAGNEAADAVAKAAAKADDYAALCYDAVARGTYEEYTGQLRPTPDRYVHDPCAHDVRVPVGAYQAVRRGDG